VRWEQGLSAALILAIAGVTFSALFSEHGLTHLLRLRAERRELGRSAFALLEQNHQLREEVQRLRSDDRHLEQLARQPPLGLVRPNELVYRPRPKAN
jgi:cell division protein FtsB